MHLYNALYLSVLRPSSNYGWDSIGKPGSEPQFLNRGWVANRGWVQIDARSRIHTMGLFRSEEHTFGMNRMQRDA